MILEMHCHTAEHSGCSHVSAADVVQRIFDIDLQGTVLTDHHYLWPQQEIDGLRRKIKVPGYYLILSGQEVATPELGQHRRRDRSPWHRGTPTVMRDPAGAISRRRPRISPRSPLRLRFFSLHLVLRTKNRASVSISFRSRDLLTYLDKIEDLIIFPQKQRRE